MSPSKIVFGTIKLMLELVLCIGAILLCWVGLTYDLSDWFIREHGAFMIRTTGLIEFVSWTGILSGGFVIYFFVSRWWLDPTAARLSKLEEQVKRLSKE